MQIVSVRPAKHYSREWYTERRWKDHKRDVGGGSFCCSVHYGSQGSSKEQAFLLLHDMPTKCEDGVEEHSRIETTVQARAPLSANQRYCATFFLCSVLGKNARVMYREELEAAREKNMHFDVLEVDDKYPYYYDVVEERPFEFTSENGKTRI